MAPTYWIKESTLAGNRTATLTIRVMKEADLDATDTLRSLAGWNQTRQDWLRLLGLQPEGCFVAEQEGQVIGTVTTTCYGSRLAWIGMLLVHPEQRGRGVGRALMRHALDYVRTEGVVCAGLDASPAGEPLYLSLGFRPVWALARWEASAPKRTPLLPSNAHVQPVQEAHWEAIVDMEAHAFGVPRPRLLHTLAQESQPVNVATDESGQVHGFGMRRAGAGAHYLGPVIAQDPPCAVALIASLLQGLEGQPVCWSIPAPNRAAVGLAEAYGFTCQRGLTRMVLGPRPQQRPEMQFAITGFATG
jgi:predicted N-acetyltransferase YhbS